MKTDYERGYDDGYADAYESDGGEGPDYVGEDPYHMGYVDGWYACMESREENKF